MKFDKLYFLNCILFLTCLGCGLYAVSGDVLFGDNPLKPMPTYGMFILMGCFFVSLIAMLVINVKKNHYRPSRILLIAFAFILLMNIITTKTLQNGLVFNVAFGEGLHDSYVVNISLLSRFIYILQFLIVLSITFLMIDVIPKISHGHDSARWGAYFGLIVIFVVMIIGYFMEYESYIKFFTVNIQEYAYKYPVQSLLPNKNSYAVVLLSALVACLYLHQRKFRWYWLVAATFIYLNILFTVSKTTIAASTFLIIGYFIYRFILSIKKHPVRNSITLASFLLIIGGFVWTLCYLDNKQGDIFSSFISFMRIGADFWTFSSRTILWDKVIQILNQTNWLTGVGFHVFNVILDGFKSTGTSFSHNGALELLGNGGIILLAFVVLIIAYLLYLLVKETKKHLSFTIFEYLIIAAMIVECIAESGNFILPSTIDYFFVSFIVIVPIMERKATIESKLLFEKTISFPLQNL